MWLGVDGFHSLVEDLERGEISTTVVITPGLGWRPCLGVGQELMTAGQRRNGRSGAGFGVETISAAMLPVHIPVTGRDVIVRPGHLHAACASHRGGRGGGGREHGV